MAIRRARAKLRARVIAPSITGTIRICITPTPKRAALAPCSSDINGMNSK